MADDDWEAAAQRLAAESLQRGDATGWFDRLYAGGRCGEHPMPWSRTEPNALLSDWAPPAGGGRRAVVVGCGLGADAEFVAGLGFATVAFDISSSAIAEAASRYPNSTVTYLNADVLNPPEAWRKAFHLVVEIYTVQALPDPSRAHAIANIASLVAPGGTLFVVAFAGGPALESNDPPPWPLSRAEIESFGADGLTVVQIERMSDGDVHRWRAEFRRPPSP